MLAAEMPCWPNRSEHLLTTKLAVAAVGAAVAVVARRWHQPSPARSKSLLSLQTAAVVAAVVVIGHPTLSWASPLYPLPCPKVCWGRSAMPAGITPYTV